MQFPKSKRIKNRELLNYVKHLRCAACGSEPEGGVDPAHIRSVGAGGDDTWMNLLPLCRWCHRRQHDKGWVWFAGNYPHIKYELLVRGREDLLEVPPEDPNHLLFP